jgi:hypothetical protein
MNSIMFFMISKEIFTKISSVVSLLISVQMFCAEDKNKNEDKSGDCCFCCVLYIITIMEVKENIFHF